MNKAATIEEIEEALNAIGESAELKEGFSAQADDAMELIEGHVEALTNALLAQSATDDMPCLEGEELLKKLGWNGEQDIDDFKDRLRKEALGLKS